MLQQNNHNIILPKYFCFVKKKGSSLALPANGLGGSRATSLLVAYFALQNTKFESEKGKVQNPARIPPQTPPAGGKKAEAGSAEASNLDFSKCDSWRRRWDSNP